MPMDVDVATDPTCTTATPTTTTTDMDLSQVQHASSKSPQTSPSKRSADILSYMRPRPEAAAAAVPVRVSSPSVSAAQSLLSAPVIGSTPRPDPSATGVPDDFGRIVIEPTSPVDAPVLVVSTRVGPVRVEPRLLEPNETSLETLRMIQQLKTKVTQCDGCTPLVFEF